MVIFTSICANYIPKARVLANSLKHYNPKIKFFICLVEREPHPRAKSENIDSVITVSELKIPDFESFMFKYNTIEASTAVKGYFFQELLNEFPHEEHFVYLDPDVFVMGSFDELKKVLKSNSIVLIPHLIEPELDLEAVEDNEIAALKHGVFNLGFLAIRRSKNAKNFLNWWTKRLHWYCYADIKKGLFTDQRWIDLAPCFFDTFILKNPGYNLAPWNLSRRYMTKNSSGYFVNSHKLIFVHFSGWDSGANEEMITKYSRNKRDVIFELRNLYLDLLNKQGQKNFGSTQWSFSYYSNGVKIPDSHRLLYRTKRALQKKFKDPFKIEAKPSFYQYATSPFRWILPDGGIRLPEKIWGAYKKGGVRFLASKVRRRMNKRIFR